MVEKNFYFEFNVVFVLLLKGMFGVVRNGKYMYDL